MADNAKDTAPGTHPDAVVINDDGSVTTRGGRGFVWVTDAVTNARVDVPASMLPREGLTPVAGYPVNYKPVARSPKTALQLADVPPTAGRASSATGQVSPALAAARAAGAALSSSTDPAVPTAAEHDAGAAGDLGDAAGDKPTTSSTSTAKGRAAR